MGFLSKVREPFMEFVTAITKGTLFVIVTVMCCLVLTQVMTRYVMSNTPPWMSELSTYCLIWTAFLGASLAFRNGKHVAIEIVTGQLPHKIRRIVFLTANIVLIGFLITFFIASLKFAVSVEQQKSATMGISIMWPVLGMPAGTLLMILQVLDVMFEEGGKRC